MALGSTKPLTEMSIRCISWGKGDRYIRLTNLPPSYAVVMKSGNLSFLETSGPLQACNGTALPLPFIRQREQMHSIITYNLQLTLPLQHTTHFRTFSGSTHQLCVRHRFCIIKLGFNYTKSMSYT